MFCPNCGQVAADDAAFCGNCGQRLARAVPQVDTRRRGLVALTAYLGVVLVLLTVGWFYLWPWLESRVSTAEVEGVTDNEPGVSVALITEEAAEAAIVVSGSSTPTQQPVTATSSPTALPSETATTSPTMISTLSSTATPVPTWTPLPGMTPSVTPDPGPEMITIGQSAGGRPIEAVRFGNGPNQIVFIGGLHAGFAPGTVSLAQGAVGYFSQNVAAVPDAVTLYIVISANPDTPHAPGELRGRLNANQVDLNRNWECNWVRDAKWRNEVIPNSGGTAPFSEPETRSMADFLQSKENAVVVFWEARAEDGLVSPGACSGRSQVSEGLAQTYGQAAGYPVADFEALTNQELNGDGTNWLDQQGIPAIAVLLPDYTDIDWDDNLAGMLAVLQAYAD